MSRLFLAVALVFCFLKQDSAADNFIIKGTVTDESAVNFIEGVKAEILELNKFTHTNSSGFFRFDDIPAGNYILRFSAEGYYHKVITIKLDSLTALIELKIKLSTFESVIDTINVNAEYFKKNPEINTSHTYAVYEELRKTPGTVEDIIKYFQSSPGVSIGSDQENNIICRGGTPLENLTLIDGIELDNPNHYGPPGSTSGALSYINLKLVQEADFYSGGFPVMYGERISSVLDIKFKEGSRDKHLRDLYFSFAGFGGFVEGPITSKSSYMLSIRRSYLELLENFLSMGSSQSGYVIPNYWDVNMKLNLNLSKNEKLSFAGVFAIDKAKYIDSDEDLPVNLKLFTYGLSYLFQNSVSAFKLTLSHNHDEYKADYHNFDLNILQNRLTLQAEYTRILSKELKLNVFSGAKYIYGNYDVFAYFYLSNSGFLLEDVKFKKRLSTYKPFGGFNATWSLLSGKLIANAGVRADYLDYMTYGLSLSPRTGLTYKLNDKIFLNFNIGYYRQAPEFLWLLSTESNKKLSYISSSQTVVGADYFPFSDLKISLETYYKFYTGYPVSLNNPYSMFIYGLTGTYPQFLSETVSKGRGYFTGIDFTIQKKNSGCGFYGFFTYSYTHSKFYALAGGAHPSGFDYGNQFTAIAGWKLENLWAFSIRAKYYDGRPYTPPDMEASRYYNGWIEDILNYMSARMPDYLRIDLRIDKDFDFSWSQLTIYFEVQNILNRKNPWFYDWSSSKGRLSTTYQWPILPILGISCRF